ncbi:uncharacterized protein I303_107488 [Kwoniella dejecticola CBS 10117]|uniref:Heat shock protein 9/12-domain-containing protein n=1 Tax=Kwoniella dejecticola CBS 10117 TaxID=1296121 RepID=A0A1A5ZZW1_9TREE|nr:uncharacterized protein I303_06893 [Kwoniella dejecticola CBS 10117]OBR83328.1 hypothetical protein I303_06893 [Kwoniella dejecticola CBS 10117]
MSDAGRQSLTDKAGAALKPDSEKTYLEQGKDMLAGKADSAASSAQPQSQKSYTQEIGDAVSGNSNENQSSIADKAKDALGMNKQ